MATGVSLQAGAGYTTGGSAGGTDVEYGTFLPEVNAVGSTLNAVVYQDRHGRWARVGKLVYCSFHISWTNLDGFGIMYIRFPPPFPTIEGVFGAHYTVNNFAAIRVFEGVHTAISTDRIYARPNAGNEMLFFSEPPGLTVNGVDNPSGEVTMDFTYISGLWIPD